MVALCSLACKVCQSWSRKYSISNTGKFAGLEKFRSQQALQKFIVRFSIYTSSATVNRLNLLLYSTGKAMLPVYLLWLFTLSAAVGKETQTMISFSLAKSQPNILDQCIKRHKYRDSKIKLPPPPSEPSQVKSFPVCVKQHTVISLASTSFPRNTRAD